LRGVVAWCCCVVWNGWWPEGLGVSAVASWAAPTAVWCMNPKGLVCVLLHWHGLCAVRLHFARTRGEALEAELNGLRGQVQELATLREHQSETIAKQKQEVARLLRLTDKLKAQLSQPRDPAPAGTPAAPAAAAPVAAPAPPPAARPSTRYDPAPVPSVPPPPTLCSGAHDEVAGAAAALCPLSV
jgi:hypothetical protein